MQQSSYDYDDDKFDSWDKDTWLYYKNRHVHLEWAMDFDLIPWEDYCPICGYTVLNDETIEPFVLCLACGGTTVEEEDPYELDAIAYAEKQLKEERERDKPIPRERKKRYPMEHMLIITKNTWTVHNGNIRLKRLSVELVGDVKFVMHQGHLLR